MSKIAGFLNLYDSPNLGALTEHRTLGSTSFLGRFALMDFALSNFSNSGIDEINVLVKDNFRSVSKHVGSFKPWINNTKAARQNILLNELGVKNPKYNTDLNCLKENDWCLLEAKADYVVFQPAHIVTTANIREIVDEHIKSGADLSLVYGSIKDADQAFIGRNIVKIKDNKVVGCKKNSGKDKEALVSLEIYVFSTNLLFNILHDKDYAEQLSLRKVVEKLISKKEAVVHAIEYTGYFRCFDSLNHFMEYSLELLDSDPAGTLFREDWPIYTTSHNTPPTSYGASAKVKNSFVANGAIIKGSVENSIISRYVTIGTGAVVKNSIILAGTYIDPHARVENAVIDKYSHVAANGKVQGSKSNPAYIEQGKLVK